MVISMVTYSEDGHNGSIILDTKWRLFVRAQQPPDATACSGIVSAQHKKPKPWPRSLFHQLTDNRHSGNKTN